MRNLFNKSSFKNIVSTMGRFISLVLVSFLGAGMLAGLLTIAPDMQTTADDYLRDQDTSDVQIQSPFGFGKDDLSRIKNTKNVSQSQTTTTFDGVGKVAKSSYTMRVFSIPQKPTGLNKLSLIKGHLPEKSNEAVIVMPPDGIKNIKLSDSISFDKRDTAGLTKNNRLKIVGVVKSRLYPHNKQGTSSKGNGTVDFVLFASRNGFRKNSTNSIFVKFNNTSDLNSFSSKYEDVVNKDVNQIRRFSTHQAKKQYQRLNNNINEQQKKLNVLEQTSGADPQINQFGRSLSRQKNSLKKISNPQWYFETRNQSLGFVIIKSDAQSMKSLATIFPIIFFLVAALVALTSMTRMIDEERTLIGTFKSLGYSDEKIASRYLIYASSATLIGSVIGILAGFQELPRMIWSAYSTQYSLPFIQLNFHWNYALLALLTMMLVITGITAWTIFKTLQESTAQLLTPKAPPAGKRILLERMNFIWKHLSFSQKVTQRNIFLDKKRMLMTVIGVIGSTALLVTGFGLQNSATSFPREQYQHIIKYNMTATVNDTDSLSNSVEKIVSGKSLVKKSLVGRDESIEVSSDNSGIKKYYINLIAPKEAQSLSDFVLLKNDSKNVSLKKDGVIITDNIANRLKLKVGDRIKGKLLTDYDTKDMKVTGIVNNYHLNYIYMSSGSYQRTFGKKHHLNTIFMKANDANQTKHVIEKIKGIKNVELTKTTMNRLETNMKSIQMVVVILIILASLLAIVVLYSVTNINIEERQREIATLKVLGFKDSETNAYVFRETIGLSLMGTIIGLFFGGILFQQVIQSFGTEYYVFDTSMNLMTFVYSTCFSILFIVIINLLMIPKIRRIDMLQSLKSVD